MQYEFDAVAIGAGPAGLTAAYLLAKSGKKVLVLEADPTYVGGISKTVEFSGYRVDIGGHRFFSKSEQVENLWREILPNDMLERSRKSRIFYNGKFYSYPLRPIEALLNLGFFTSCLCIISYAYAQIFPIKHPKTFSQWVRNHFGDKLFTIFFKTYTEKVWGMNCDDISADWAAQRIKGLSLWSAVFSALRWSRPRDKKGVIKTLIDRFLYPPKGPGMMWEACAALVRSMGGVITMDRRVDGLKKVDGGFEVRCKSSKGIEETYFTKHVLSSAPMRELILGLSPPPQRESLVAAQALRYRDFLTVALVCRDEGIFDDNWIYIHEPAVKVGRIQNFKAWSPAMVPDNQTTCLGLEYFCFEGDGLWNMSDTDLIELAKKEMAILGIVAEHQVTKGFVVRQPKAYPVYDDEYQTNVEMIRKEIETSYPGLHLMGRNGMHKYNNQDHAMMTAMLTVENILAGSAIYDVWRVNQDAEYHEEVKDPNEGGTGERLVPRRAA